MNKLLKIYSVLTSFGMLLVLLMGAIVTKTGSGEGCGNSWPLCYGQVLPTAPELETIIEYSHRVVSAALGFMVIILAIWTWKKIGRVRETKFLAFMSVFLIVFQGLLGAAAVVWGQSDTVLAAHFGISLASFASVVLLTVLVFEHSRMPEGYVPSIPKRIRVQIYLLTTYVYVVVYTGALVRHTGSSMACSTWPLCNGYLIPPLSGQVAVQFFHRVAAAIAFLWLLSLVIQALKIFKEEKVVYWSFIISFLLILSQVTTGALIIITELNMFIALAHGLFIAGLFTVLTYLIMLSLRNK
ncbi:COX15/CtaA family protein [Pseudalkalibacillus caeni]|uniref:Heme A synthase n=1 Tax=Exobacillus caeni TaxID=2574798 RepID=A0A5R9F7Q9_9BACL|nr:heme A synthase [Pseudalkalibacillus caeni]TLS37668.1 heme A synthase [Pseudalkalibacillus caeni]